MTFIKLLKYKQKGHLGQYEDWWRLYQKEDGSFVVQHEWDHVSVGSGGSRSGEELEPATQAEIDAAKADPVAAARIV